MIKNGLKKERERRGLTQSSISKIMGIPQSLYSQFETGRSMPDGANELSAMCEAIGIEPGDVYPAEILAALYGIKRTEPEPVKPPRQFFSVKLPAALAPRIDEEVLAGGYTTRTEFVVDTVRQRLKK